jgi:hypothetical protein
MSTAVTTTAPRSPSRGDRLAPLAGVLCAAACAAAASLYLPHAGLWNDEATQLAGLALGPVEQARWLADWSQHDFGVPDDRMPPLSYWVGWAWSKAFGLNEASLRGLGVSAAALASWLIFAAARRAWGVASGLASGLLFGLSPGVVVLAVEVRAYPLLLLASAAAFYCLVRFAEDPAGGSRSWLPALAACGVAAAYTHFFGLVLAGATLTAALACARLRRAPLAPVVVAALAAGAASLGLLPFVKAAFGLSKSATAGPVEPRALGLMRLGYRLFAHASLTVCPAVLGLAAAGAAAAGLAALAPKRTRPSLPLIAVVTAWAAGAVVVAAAQFGLRQMQAAAASYNAWMLPAGALVLGSGLAAASRRARAVAAAGVVAMLGAYAYGDFQLAAHGDSFAHTPHKAIDALVRRFGGPARAAVVFDGPDLACWHVYAPLRYAYAGALRHYVAEPGPDALTLARYPDGDDAGDPSRLPVDALILVRPRSRSAAEVVAGVREGVARPVGDGPAATALKNDRRWTLAAEATYPAFVTADVDVFTRAAPE